MKEYPSITKDVRSDINIYAFLKYDGSQIRAEWSQKRGFYKFGSRTRMLGEDDPLLGEAIDLIKNLYEEDLSLIFREQKWDGVVCFFEFFGPQSFAGHHIKEPHQVILFDVNPFKQGILDPKLFIKFFGHLNIPAVLHYGKCNATFIESVRDGSLENLPENSEGVVCKGKDNKRTPMPVMFKIKNRAWLLKLKNHCKGDEKLFHLLS